MLVAVGIYVFRNVVIAKYLCLLKYISNDISKL